MRYNKTVGLDIYICVPQYCGSVSWGSGWGPSRFQQFPVAIMFLARQYE